MTDWSPQQQSALTQVDVWLANRESPIFRLFGFAGTGKSTLAKYIGALENERGGYVQYASFTGKAAVVMKRKGCANARTLHSVIYSSHEKSQNELSRLQGVLSEANRRNAPTGELYDVMLAIKNEEDSLKQPGFSLKPKSSALAIWGDEEDSRPVHTISLFVIDECSMVDERLGKDLMSFNIPIIVLGDPAQLPPVAGQGFFTKASPDALLTEIHRQALGSPIIDMANQVRQGNNLHLGQFGGGCGVVTPGELKAEDWLAADQILVGRNLTRKAFNGRCRQLKGFDDILPMPGEKLVCLRNAREEGLLNGSLWECLSAEDINPISDSFKIRVRSLDGDGAEVETLAHKCHFLNVEMPAFTRMDANEFDYGYALTVHKAQGSQWDNVLLMDEWNQRDTRQQWLYTGITRAAERITVVRR
jgi:exodeoxyribonuclease-5